MKINKYRKYKVYLNDVYITSSVSEHAACGYAQQLHDSTSHKDLPVTVTSVMDWNLLYSALWERWVELPTNRVVCLFKGHLWDSQRPSGPLGFDPDRCWRCDTVRAYYQGGAVPGVRQPKE